MINLSAHCLIFDTALRNRAPIRSGVLLISQLNHAVEAHLLRRTALAEPERGGGSIGDINMLREAISSPRSGNTGMRDSHAGP
jgi:hypothetical protein